MVSTVCSQVRCSDTTLSDPLGFEGIRIFDLTDPTAPVYLKGIRTNCGSHTNTLIPDLDNNRVLIYATTASNGGGLYCEGPSQQDPDRRRSPGRAGESERHRGAAG